MPQTTYTSALDVPKMQEGDILDVGGVQKTLNPEGNLTELGIISTDQVAQNVQQDTQRLSELSGTPTVGMTRQFGGQNQTFGADNNWHVQEPTVPTNTVPTEPAKIKYINLDGQTTELSGEALTPEAVQALKNQGYFPQESSGNVPSWAAIGNVDQGKLEAEAAKAKKEKDDLIAGMSSFMMSDAELASQINSISGLYDTRIRDMEDINKRRKGALETTGLRLGSRYTGGSGGVFGGIVTEEERQGSQRITELQAQKEGAINAAKVAAKAQKWTIYSKQLDLAEKAYQDQQEALKEFNKTLVEQNKKIAEEKIKVVEAERLQEVEGLVSDALTKTSDPNAIFSALTQAGYKTNSKEVADAIKNLSEVEGSNPGIVGEWLSAKRNDPAFKDMGLEEYNAFKNPGAALDLQEKRLRIQKIQDELGGNGLLGTDNKIIPNITAAQKINKEIVNNDAYKVIRKGQDSLQYLTDFEKAFDTYGLQTVPGPGKGELASKYQTAILNLKEFFNLGVLNGPDLTVLEGIMPSPVKNPATVFGVPVYPKKFQGIASAVSEGIKTLKGNMEKTLDDRYQSLSTQYGDYSSESVKALQDLNRIYVNQKAMLNPNVKRMLDENPELTPEDILTILK